MDATVDQIDGYRFVYCLPFAPDRMFVEDTYYSDTPGLDVPAIRARIADYAQARGWAGAEVVRREAGSLPITLGGDFDAYWRSTGKGIAKAGMRAGLFQPATGYSLPTRCASPSRWRTAATGPAQASPPSPMIMRASTGDAAHSTACSTR